MTSFSAAPDASAAAPIVAFGESVVSVVPAGFAASEILAEPDLEAWAVEPTAPLR